MRFEIIENGDYHSGGAYGFARILFGYKLTKRIDKPWEIMTV